MRPHYACRRWLSVNKLAWLVTLAMVLYLAVPGVAWPCTTFVLRDKDRLYFGRNLDWQWEDGLVVINPREVRKTAFVMPPATPARWTSKYGSVTFNQFGQEMPFGGMNEAGLVVENMWLAQTEYAPADSRAGINLLQWIQYQLDNCRTVEEVLATDGRLRVEAPPIKAQDMPRIHYLVCDANGDCATVEFLGGKMSVHHGGELSYRVLANDTYEQSLAYNRQHPDPAKIPGRLKDISSQARFARAVGRVEGFKAKSEKEDVSYAFATLDQVCQGDYTAWRIVYDIPGRRIHYLARSHQQIRMLDFKSLDFSRSRPVQFLDLQAKTSAPNALALQDLTEARHRQYLERFCGQESVKQAFGELGPIVDAQLQVLRTFTPATP